MGAGSSLLAARWSSPSSRSDVSTGAVTEVAEALEKVQEVDRSWNESMQNPDSPFARRAAAMSMGNLFSGLAKHMEVLPGCPGEYAAIVAVADGELFAEMAEIIDANAIRARREGIPLDENGMIDTRWLIEGRRSGELD